MEEESRLEVNNNNGNTTAEEAASLADEGAGLKKMLNGKEVFITFMSKKASSGQLIPYYRVYAINSTGQISLLTNYQRIGTEEFSSSPNAAMDNNGRIVLVTTQGKLIKYFTGQLGTDYKIVWKKGPIGIADGAVPSVGMNDRSQIVLVYRFPSSATMDGYYVTGKLNTDYSISWHLQNTTIYSKVKTDLPRVALNNSSNVIIVDEFISYSDRFICFDYGYVDSVHKRIYFTFSGGMLRKVNNSNVWPSVSLNEANEVLISYSSGGFAHAITAKLPTSGYLTDIVASRDIVLDFVRSSSMVRYGHIKDSFWSVWGGTGKIYSAVVSQSGAVSINNVYNMGTTEYTITSIVM